MEKITLKLFEFYNLDAELNGLTNQQTGEKVAAGLLQEKLPLITKYWLSDLAKKAAAEKAAVEELKNELIKKYGKEDDKGGISIPMVIDATDESGAVVYETPETPDSEPVVKKILNPDFESFNKEFNDLLQTEKEVEHNKFMLADFANVETSENYNTFFKLLSVTNDDAKVVPIAPVK